MRNGNHFLAVIITVIVRLDELAKASDALP